MVMKLADCRVKTTVDVIRGKWKPSIIHALKPGKRGYAELRRIIPEPTQKVLTEQLRELERDRIISRTVSVQRIVRTQYALTDYGRTLVPVLEQMCVWGQRHKAVVLDGGEGSGAPTNGSEQMHRAESRRSKILAGVIHI